MSKKDEQIVIRVTESQKKEIKMSAGALGLNVSSYILYLYNKYGKNE